MDICKSLTNDGTRCKRKALPGRRYCWQHSSGLFKGLTVGGLFAIALALISLVADLKGLGLPIPSINISTPTLTLTTTPTITFSGNSVEVTFSAPYGPGSLSIKTKTGEQVMVIYIPSYGGEQTVQLPPGEYIYVYEYQKPTPTSMTGGTAETTTLSGEFIVPAEKLYEFHLPTH